MMRCGSTPGFPRMIFTMDVGAQYAQVPIVFDGARARRGPLSVWPSTITLRSFSWASTLAIFGQGFTGRGHFDLGFANAVAGFRPWKRPAPCRFLDDFEAAAVKAFEGFGNFFLEGRYGVFLVLEGIFQFGHASFACAEFGLQFRRAASFVKGLQCGAMPSFLGLTEHLGVGYENTCRSSGSRD